MGKAQDIKKALEILGKLKDSDLYGFKREVAEDLIKRKVEAEYHYFRKCGWSNKEISEDLNRVYLNENALKLWLSEFAEIKKAILERRLVVNWKGGLYWGVGMMKDGVITGISLTTMKVLCGYHLNYDKRAYYMSVYGTDRALEIILQFGYRLGLKFKEIPQNQNILY